MDVKEAADFAKNIWKRISKIGKGVMNESDTVSTGSGGSGKIERSFIKSLFGGGSSKSSLGPQEQVESKKPKKPSSNGKVTEDDIGDPTGFKHLSHIGFNPATGTFDVQNIPPQWKKFFEAAGVGRSELEDKKTAKFIVDFVERTNNQTRKAPPPPPPKIYKAAPPPPPKVKPVQRGVPNTSPDDRPEQIKRSVQSSHSKTSTATSTRNVLVKSNNIPQAPPFEDYLAFIEERKQKAAHKEQEQFTKPPRPPQPPAAPSLNDQLLSSIRSVGVGGLRHIETSSPTPSSASLDVPEDAMAGLLAKALQNRNKAIAHSDSESSAGEWS